MFVGGLLAVAPLMRPAQATPQFSTTNDDTTYDTAAAGRNLFETLALTTQSAPLDGKPTNCPVINIPEIAQIPDGGWTWVDPANPIQELAGVVNQTIEVDPTKEDPTTLSSFVRYSDFPTAHNSHDHNTHLTVDEAYRGLLSLTNNLADDHGPIANAGDIALPTQLEAEWEIGISPVDSQGDGHAGANGGPIFPKWAWPNPGDRVWIMGNHIYDCGHPIAVAGVGRYKSEIHPAIAMASMRNQVMTLPSTGTTPVPVVATDLYIHGDGGWATSVINTHDVLDEGTYFTTPIDRDYDFDIHLPPKPDPAAVLEWRDPVADGPFNTIAIDPVLTPELGDPADPKLHVHVPLKDSGVGALDTYGRQIVAGWAVPQGPVRHLKIKLTQMVLHDDMDTAPGDGELSFWMNVSKAPAEWQRLSDFDIPTFEDGGTFCPDQTNTMEDYDDDGNLCGNGILNFSGPTFDFFVMDGTPVSIEAIGYEQDCYDGIFGFHDLLGLSGNALCITSDGDNDPYKTLKVSLAPPGYHVGQQLIVSNTDDQYELHFTVTEVDSTPPTASPTQAPAANAAGWNKSDVTVTWNWTDEAGGSGIDAANCTTSSVSSGEGDPIPLNASCKDQAGNIGSASHDVTVDKTAPTVTVTGVTSGGTYVFGAGPAPGCNTTDSLSHVATPATVSITTPPGGVGLFKATCSGAVDVAGNPQAADVSVSYSVVYGFGGFLSPLPKSTLQKSGASIAVKFRLTDANGAPISAVLSAALAAAGKVQVTLAGPPAISVTAACSWDPNTLFFQCNIKTPKGLLTGVANPYAITAYEDVGTGFVVAPPVGTAVNPETIYFK
ncbi:MAG: hypothetical protein ACJ77I_04905 [Chloroflexota bacterium]